MIKINFCVNRASVLWSQYTLCLIRLEGFKNKNSWQDSELVRTALYYIDIVKAQGGYTKSKLKILLFCGKLRKLVKRSESQAKTR